MQKSFSDIGLLGSYEILEKIGAGGMGTVYKARHPKSGNIVAIKVLSPEYIDDSMLLKRFRREFEAAAKLNHPHIVRVVEYGMEGTYPYLVMEYVEGTSLAAVLRRQKRLLEDDAIRISLQIAEALNLAHLNQIIHRDVNPANILIDHEGQTRLIDLGLVKDAGNSGLMTRSRTCMGTLIYAAPEQFEDARGVDGRADIYSLGATLYQAVTGAYPFQSGNTFSMLQRKLNNQLVDPTKLVPSLSRRTADAILAAMQADPAKRPVSCAEFAAMLSDNHHLSRWFRLDRNIKARENSAKAADSAENRRSGDESADDRRRANRHVFGGIMDCRPLMKAAVEPVVAEAIDISSTGLGLLTPRRFEKGTLVQVEFQERDRAARQSLIVKVCWVRPQSEGRWSLGGRFHRPLTEAELNSLLEHDVHTVVLAKSDRKS